MSKITNDGLTRSGTGCYIAMETVGIKGLNDLHPFAATKQRLWYSSESRV